MRIAYQLRLMTLGSTISITKQAPVSISIWKVEAVLHSSALAQVAGAKMRGHIYVKPHTGTRSLHPTFWADLAKDSGVLSPT
jgi:hypothetical protein